MSRFAPCLQVSRPDHASPGRPGWALVGVMAALALAVPAPAASPRTDLLRLVPQDVGFCLVVSDLRGHTEKLLASPWIKKLCQSPLAQAVAGSPEFRQLQALEGRIHQRLKISFARLRDDILGDAVVFAYRPGPPEHPEEEQGLVLLWARHARLLSQTVDLLNRDLKQLQTRVHRDVKYFRRVEGRGRSNYYYLNGPVLAFSSREDMVREVIDRVLGPKTGAKDRTDGSVGNQLRRLGIGPALASLWFNPRAFDAHVRQGVAAASGAPAAACKTFLVYWQALEGAALAVIVDRDFALKLAIRARTEALPPAARRFFTLPSKASDLWSRFPPDALVAGAGRIDAVAFAEVLAEFLPPKARGAWLSGLSRDVEAGFGLDMARDILPYLGPDWGFCITGSSDPKVLLPMLTWALRVRPGPRKTPVDQALWGGLNSAALFAVFSYNNSRRPDALRLRSVMQDKVEVKYLENEKKFPAGLRPAFAVKAGYLVLSTSPEAVQDFSKGSSAAATSAEVPLLRVSLRAWGNFLKARRAALAGYLAEKDHISRAKANLQLHSLFWVLSLFDRLELSQRTGGGQVTWTLTVRVAESADR